MASAIPNTNGFHFSSASSLTNLLDRENVVFGRVTEDDLGFLDELEKIGAKPYKSKKDVEIFDYDQL